MTPRRHMVSIALVLLAMSGGVSLVAQRNAAPSANPSSEWRHYGGDFTGARYAPLSQITAANFDKLEIAWRFKTDNLGPRPEFQLEGTPLMANGVIYATGGTRRSIVALDAKTGEIRWVHSFDEGTRAAASPRQLSGRGLSYWTDGRGDERIFYITIGYRLVALDAHDGSRVRAFGKDGIIDLKEGVHVGARQQIDLEKGEAGSHQPPTVAGNTLVVPVTFGGDFTPPTHNNSKGVVRAFDARTGKQLWRFDTIPAPGEFGNETWLNGSWAENGNTGVWGYITVDESLGLVYVPVSQPTNGFYGGHRPGANLFGETLVCLDLKTGKRKWHFQLVHHPIWDMDMPSQPILMDIVADGRPVKAVGVPTKQAFFYVFDRVTGEPVWPIVEQPVEKGDVPGEWYSPTQPIPTKPPAYSRNELKLPDDLIDFTPELRAQALEKLKLFRISPKHMVFAPPVAGNVNGLLGSVRIGGGSNWPGGGYDPETHTAYMAHGYAGFGWSSIVAPPPDFSDMKYVRGVGGVEFEEVNSADIGTAQGVTRPPRSGPSGTAIAEEATRVEGLPMLKPPYGVLTAIDLDRGEIKWHTPHGDTPDQVRNHPKLKGLDIGKTGQSGSPGVVVTKTLVIVGDPQVTTMPGRPRGAMLRAYDKASGKQVGAVWMPARQSGSPMTYMLDGKQYLVVAIGGGNYSGEYIAFALPDSERKTDTR